MAPLDITALIMQLNPGHHASTKLSAEAIPPRPVTQYPMHLCVNIDVECSSQISHFLQYMTPYPQFLLFGDSLLQIASHLVDGFSLAAALQSPQDYIRRLDVINRGLSGYNTSQALKILPEVIPSVSSARVEFLLILFGANDACLPDAPTRQHVPLHTYKENLKTIVTHPAVVAHRPKIILVTPPPIDEIRQEEVDAAKGYMLCRRASVTAEYAEAARQVGTEAEGNIVVLDLWSAVMTEAIRTTSNRSSNGPILGSKQLGSNEALVNLMPDGLHLGNAGYTLFFNALLSTLENNWPTSSPYVFPDWHMAPKIEQDATK